LPNVIHDPGFHGWRHPGRLRLASDVVIGEVVTISVRSLPHNAAPIVLLRKWPEEVDVLGHDSWEGAFRVVRAVEGSDGHATGRYLFYQSNADSARNDRPGPIT
jgi:hypothetical protein